MKKLLLLALGLFLFAIPSHAQSFDVSGSYRLAFLASIASYLVGCVAFWGLRRPPTRQVV